MSDVKLTKAQIDALDRLSVRDCGWVHPGTAKFLSRKGLVERFGSTLTEWWAITDAGRIALAQAREDGE